jgi:hypothetical protein
LTEKEKIYKVVYTTNINEDDEEWKK